MPRLPVKAKDDVNHIDVKVDYSKGGANYFSGGRDKRGIWMYVQGTIIRDDNCVSYILGRGQRFFLEELARVNPKKLQAWRTMLDADISTRSGSLWDKVLLAAEKMDVELGPFVYANVTPEIAKEIANADSGELIVVGNEACN